jgi:methionyl-tRNA synthetase
MNEEPEFIIPLDLFAQVELRIGAIRECEEIPKSDKLLKLTVDFGLKGIRTILAGVKKWYKPEELIGKQTLFVYNLKPRTLFGIESQGMMLFAGSDDGTLRYISPSDTVPNGAQLQ